jgi:hypothetical protein
MDVELQDPTISPEPVADGKAAVHVNLPDGKLRVREHF